MHIRNLFFNTLTAFAFLKLINMHCLKKPHQMALKKTNDSKAFILWCLRSFFRQGLPRTPTFYLCQKLND